MFSRNRVFRDPVHGLIDVAPRDAFLTQLIDTPEFQRLHRVRQLGVGMLTFPGADHTRYCHSLGVLHVATRVLEVLKARYRDDEVANLVDKHHQTIKAAALLHDVGHGPFSHLVERAFESQKDHEERTQEMIVSPTSRIRKVLEDSGQDAEQVRDVVQKKFGFLFLQDIVSSQLDADRMDYLIRDSHFAGVRYGIFDLEWVLNCLCVGSYENSTPGPARWRLCLDERRGVQAAEQLILARQNMSLQVYFHKSTRRWEAIFLCLMREAARLADLDDLPEGTMPSVRAYFVARGKVDHESFLRLDEPLLQTAFSGWRDATLRRHRWLATLARGFLQREKVLARVEVPTDLPTDKETLLRQRLTEAFPKDKASHWELDAGSFTPYKAPDPSLKSSDPESYAEGVFASSILVSDGNPTNSAVPVSERSEIFRLLGRQQIRLRRLFCDPAILTRVRKIASDIH